MQRIGHVVIKVGLVGVPLVLVLCGFDYLSTRTPPYTVVERPITLTGAQAWKQIARHDAVNPASALIRKHRREALEAQGNVFRDDLVILHRTVRAKVMQPPDGVVAKLANWIYPVAHANAWDCFDWDDNYIDGCDDGGGDDGGGPEFDIYPFDTGDPDVTAADTVLTDYYGSEEWSTDELDNSSGDPQTIADSVRNYGQAWMHLRVNPSASWMGMPCSADGNASHANPAIMDLIKHEAYAACAAGAAAMLEACAGTGPAYFLCLGDACLVAGSAVVTYDNAAFTAVCHP